MSKVIIYVCANTQPRVCINTFFPSEKQCPDLGLVAMACYQALWTAACLKALPPREKLSFRVRALKFCLLLSSRHERLSKAPTSTLEAIEEFRKATEKLSMDDAAFLCREIQSLVDKCKENKRIEKPLFSPVYVAMVKLLCLSDHLDMAWRFLAKGGSTCHSVTLQFCDLALVICNSRKEEERVGVLLPTVCKHFDDAMEKLDLDAENIKALLDGSSVLFWVIETQNALQEISLMACIRFLQKQQEWLCWLMTKKVSVDVFTDKLRFVFVCFLECLTLLSVGNPLFRLSTCDSLFSRTILNPQRSSPASSRLYTKLPSKYSCKV